MILTVVIHTENEAFKKHPARESANILRDLADKMEESGLFQVGLHRNLFDSSGNASGFMEIEEG